MHPIYVENVVYFDDILIDSSCKTDDMVIKMAVKVMYVKSSDLWLLLLYAVI